MIKDTLTQVSVFDTQVDAEAAVPGQERADVGAHPSEPERHRRGHDEQTFHHLAAFHARLRGLDFPEHAKAMVVIPPPGLRHFQPARRAQEQGATDRDFERRDLSAHGGDGDQEPRDRRRAGGRIRRRPREPAL